MEFRGEDDEMAFNHDRDDWADLDWLARKALGCACVSLALIAAFAGLVGVAIYRAVFL